MTTDTDPPVQPHPDAHQLLGIAELLPKLSGVDPDTLQTISDYLRGLSLRVTALPVARTGPLRVAAEEGSAPVEAVPLTQDEHEVMWRALRRSVSVVQPSGDGWEDNAIYLLERCPHAVRVREGGGPENLLSSLCVTFQKMQGMLAATPPQSGKTENEIDRLETEVARLTAERDELLKHASALNDVALAVGLQVGANKLTDLLPAIRCLPAELADEKAEVERLTFEVRERLQKQQAAEAELQEVRKDAGRYRRLRSGGFTLGPTTLAVYRYPGDALRADWWLESVEGKELDDYIDAAPEATKP